jgi:hypothetical protein
LGPGGALLPAPRGGARFWSSCRRSSSRSGCAYSCGPASAVIAGVDGGG